MHNSRIDTVVQWCLHHWLALLNTLVLLYAGLPWLSPLLIAMGYTTAGNLLFHLYTPLCHQRPERSYHVFGYQVAYCHRETAMYTALFLGGMFYAVVRHYHHFRPLPLTTVGWLLLPMLVDGSTHFITDLVPYVALRSNDHAVWSVNWWVRLATGLLFAVAVVWGIYPRLEPPSINE